MDVKETVGLLYNINQIFKQVFNSRECFSNNWNCQNGRMILNHPDQLPSFVEIFVDPDTLLNAKGKDTAKSLAHREFLQSIQSKNFTIDSVNFFNFFKEVKKSEVTEMSIDDSIQIQGTKMNTEFKEIKTPILNKTEDKLIGSFSLSDDNINFIKNLKSYETFTITLDFDNERVLLNNTEKLESFIYFKLSNKFMPYLESINSEKGCEVSIDIYETEDDYIYDIFFNVKKYKINKKGEKKLNPISVRYGIRILEMEEGEQ